MSQKSQSVIERLRSRYRTDRSLRLQIRKAVAGLTLVLLLVWFLLPFVWTLKTSLQTRPIAQSYPPVFWGFDIQWSNYTDVLFGTSFLNYIRNGLIASFTTTIAAMILAVPHAYAISNYNYKIRGVSMYLILAVRVFPLVAMAIPFYLIYQEFGLINTKIGLTIVLTMLYVPFVVWIMKGFFDGMSYSLVEAARMDGCTKFQAFYRVVLPLAKPALASSTIFVWLESFNHFTLVFFLTSSPKAQTVPFGILSFVQDAFVPWNIISAASLLGMVPSLIVVVLFQKYLVRGITA